MSLARRPGFDLPPTAGLPLRAADLAPWRAADRPPRGDADLAGAMARYLGVGRALITCSGTAALTIALGALHRLAPSRDTVVVPAYTCPLVAIAVAHLGLRVRVCDLVPGTLELDATALAAHCDTHTLAVLPTHLAGRIADIDAVVAVARSAGAWVIEDAAQALGAREDGRAAGLRGDVGFYSMAVGKGLSMFEGGVLVARDLSLQAACEAEAARVAPWRSGWELRRMVELLAYAALYRPAGLRLAYGRGLRRDLARGDLIAAAGDDFDAAIPLHRPGRWRQAVAARALPRLDRFLDLGAANASRWRDALRHLAGIEILWADRPGSWPALLLRMPDRARRDGALAALWGAGYGVSLPFVHALPDYAYLHAIVPGLAAQSAPHARAMAGRVLALGNSPWVTPADRATVAAALADALRA